MGNIKDCFLSQIFQSVATLKTFRDPTLEYYGALAQI